jgi:hypothetical protein
VEKEEKKGKKSKRKLKRKVKHLRQNPGAHQFFKGN